MDPMLDSIKDRLAALEDFNLEILKIIESQNIKIKRLKDKKKQQSTLIAMQKIKIDDLQNPKKEKYTPKLAPKQLAMIPKMDFLPETQVKKFITTKYIKTLPDAITPTQGDNDSLGFDLWAIKLIGKWGDDTYVYDTGIAVEPQRGYCFEIFNRSSFAKQGYKVAGTGIIDSNYRDSIKITVKKMHPAVPDIILPFKLFQLVVRKEIFVDWILYDKLSDTDRTGGYGSTDKKIENTYELMIERERQIDKTMRIARDEAFRL